jgi:hypothetical protein
MRTFERLLVVALLVMALTAAHAQQSPPGQPGDAATDPARGAGVHHAEGPAGGAEVALSTFRTMLAALPNLPGMSQIDRDSLTVQAPLAMYTLTEGASLDQASASNTYWYPLVDSDGRPVANSEVGFRSGNLQVITSNWMGPYVDTIVPAVAQVHGIDFLRDGSYELRLLRAPPWPGSHNLLQVLWLASMTRSDDYIYVLPIPFTPGNVHSGALYRAADFVELVKPAQRLNPNFAPVWP